MTVVIIELSPVFFVMFTVATLIHWIMIPNRVETEKVKLISLRHTDKDCQRFVDAVVLFSVSDSSNEISNSEKNVSTKFESCYRTWNDAASFFYIQF